MLKLHQVESYVKGFDVEVSGTTVLDVDKPRDVKNVQGISVPFEMGSLIRVNNAQGVPVVSIGGTAGNIIQLTWR